MVIDGTLVILLLLLALLIGLAHARGGAELVRSGLGEGGRMLMRFAPVIAVSFLAAGFADVLIPTQWVRSRMGAESGLPGILLGAGAGVLTPGGPFVSMPIAAVMIRAGAGAGPVVAFVSAWGLLALHRFVAWEVPILGWRLASLRWLVCLALPIAAGALARALTPAR